MLLLLMLTPLSLTTYKSMDTEAWRLDYNKREKCVFVCLLISQSHVHNCIALSLSLSLSLSVFMQNPIHALSTLHVNS